MAWTAKALADAELREPLSVVERSAEVLANDIRNSNHFIAFTGAGISTSAGIPDYRGPDGHWTLQAQGRQRQGTTTDTLEAVPTPTHMALVELQNRGILKFVISQNCDGLHRRSGILPERISELHGNNNREYCKDCGKDYIRDYHATSDNVHDHRTGRKCAVCGGALYDSIINFGEPLPREPLRQAFYNSHSADLCLVLGTSLTVEPAEALPRIVGQKSGVKLAICNLQETPQDDLADIRVFSDADRLMTLVMARLGIPIPPFILRRRLSVDIEAAGEQRHQLKLAGIDYDNTPLSFLQSVSLLNNRRILRQEPFTFDVRGGIEVGTLLQIELEFMGHYNEPKLKLVHECKGSVVGRHMYLLDYNPQNGRWNIMNHDPSGTQEHPISISG